MHLGVNCGEMLQVKLEYLPNVNIKLDPTSLIPTHTYIHGLALMLKLKQFPHQGMMRRVKLAVRVVVGWLSS